MKQDININIESGKMIIIHEMFVPANYLGDGVWEGKLTKIDTDCDYIKPKLCYHEHAIDMNYGTKRCDKCGASYIDGKWAK